jgi:putative FmdB family regulatory protein
VPVYEYRCTACGRKFSTLVRRLSDASAATPACPACSGSAERLLSSFAYHRSLQMQIDQIDPRIERELNAADTLKDDPLSRLNLNFPAGDPD